MGRMLKPSWNEVIAQIPRYCHSILGFRKSASSSLFKAGALRIVIKTPKRNQKIGSLP